MAGGVLGLSSLEASSLLVLAAYTVTGLIGPLFGTRTSRILLYASSILALLGILYASSLPSVLHGYATGFNGAVVVDTFTVYLLLVALVIFALTALAGRRTVDQWEASDAFYAVVGLMALGLIVLGFSRVLYLVYIAWILSAVSSYVLVALYRDSVSAEAALKYAVTGTAATIILLLAVILYYGVTASLTIGAAVSDASPLLVTPVVALALIAIGFKMGMVPFHGWAIDVYGNTRPLIVALVSAIAKILAALFIVKLIVSFAVATPTIVLWVAGVLAAITMLYGNLGALTTIRDSPQKLLAYSSVAQAGYIAAGFASLATLPGIDNKAAIAGIALHTAGYALSKFAGFLVLDSQCRYPNCGWDSMRGMAWRSPAAATALVLSVASLAGMPPTLGFWGKLYIVKAVSGASTGLALLLVVNFAIAAFYYGYLIYQLFARPRQQEGVRDDRSDVAFVAALLTLILGFMPQQAYQLTVYGYS
ncbi:MAG: hypothetical protein DSY37_01385 [Hyperthermus sp.]|nr:MAG: hypothetical protein DSY37_01385 [Hyperthermus sp.]